MSTLKAYSPYLRRSPTQAPQVSPYHAAHQPHPTLTSQSLPQNAEAVQGTSLEKEMTTNSTTSCKSKRQGQGRPARALWADIGTRLLVHCLTTAARHRITPFGAESFPQAALRLSPWQCFFEFLLAATSPSPVSAQRLRAWNRALTEARLPGEGGTGGESRCRPDHSKNSSALDHCFCGAKVETNSD